MNEIERDYIRDIVETMYEHGQIDARHDIKFHGKASDITIKQIAQMSTHIVAARAAYIAGYYDAINPEPRVKYDIDYSVKWVYDESPDLSFLGEYTDKPDTSKWVYDRKSGIIESPRGFKRNIGACWERNTYRYLELESAYNLASAKSDAELMERLNDGREAVYACIVTAVYNGVEIAQASLSGVVGMDNAAAIEAELTSEAKHEAELTSEAKHEAELRLDNVKNTL